MAPLQRLLAIAILLSALLISSVAAQAFPNCPRRDVRPDFDDHIGELPPVTLTDTSAVYFNNMPHGVFLSAAWSLSTADGWTLNTDRNAGHTYRFQFNFHDGSNAAWIIGDSRPCEGLEGRLDLSQFTPADVASITIYHQHGSE